MPSGENGFSAGGQADRPLGRNGQTGAPEKSHRVVVWLKGLPLVGRYWYIGRTVSLYGFFTALGLGVERLVVHPLVKRQIGTATFGDLGLALSFLSFFFVAGSSGLVSTVMRHHSWRTPEQKPLLYATALWTAVAVALAFGVIMLFLGFAMPSLFENPNVALFSRWLVPATMFMTVVHYLGAVLRAEMRIWLGAAMENLVPVLGAVSLVLIPWLGAVGAPIGMSIGSALTIAITVVVLIKTGSMRRWFAWSRQEALVILKLMPVFALGSVMANLDVLIGRWFVGYYATREDVAYYWIAAGFGMMVGIPLAMASCALVPIICAKTSLADFDRRTIKLYYAMTLALPPLVFLAGWFIARPLMIIYGPDALEHGQRLLPYLLMGYSLHILMVVHWGFQTKFLPPWVYLAINAAALVTSVVLNVLLGPRYGALGSAIAAGASLSLKGLVSLALMTKIFFFRKPGGGEGQALAVGAVEADQADRDFGL